MQAHMKSSQSKSSKSQAGFTLIELLATVVIIVISLTLGIINYLRFLDKRELYSAGSNIEMTLKDARSKAKNGFLGNETIGYCSKLAAVEVLVTETTNNQVNRGAVANKITSTSQLRCEDNSVLVYDRSTITDNATSLDKNITISFLPMNGAKLKLAGSLVANGTAILSHNDAQVIFNLDQGGTIDVKYVTNPNYVEEHESVDDDVIIK